MHRLTLPLFGLAAGLALTATSGSIVVAQAPTVEQRQQFMKGLGAYVYNRQFRADAAQAENLPKVVAAAEEMAVKVKTIPGMFPVGSEGGNALPVIWEKPAEFEAASAKSSELATALAAAARTGDVQASQAAFQALTQQGCNACHGTFVKPSN